MWYEGIFKIDGVIFRYAAKVFDTGSKYGINGGRISKLQIYMKGDDSVSETLILNYDREWDIEPKLDIEKEALQYVLEMYNNEYKTVPIMFF